MEYIIESFDSNDRWVAKREIEEEFFTDFWPYSPNHSERIYEEEDYGEEIEYIKYHEPPQMTVLTWLTLFKTRWSIRK